MLFNTIDFAVFLPAVVILYYLLPHKFRWMLLLAASYFFYMSWKVEYVLLIVASTLVDNLDRVGDEEFIDRNWTTEHYAEKGRKIIAGKVAGELKAWYGDQYRDPSGQQPD